MPYGIIQQMQIKKIEKIFVAVVFIPFANLLLFRITFFN